MDRIVEIAAVRTDASGAIVGEFCSLVRAAASGAQEVHGITSAQVRAAPAFATIAPSVLALTHDTVLVAHNAAFDRAFLVLALAELGLPAPGIIRCTRGMDDALRPAGASASLTATCARYGISHAPAHRALSDARATAALYHALNERLSQVRRHAA